MGVVKRIICLANSRKLSGRCIAGVEISSKGQPLGWIRPVSAREHEEVSEHERQYEDGSDPCVLDVVDIPLLGPNPKGYQAENWRLDPDYYWIRHRRHKVAELGAFLTPMPTLWVNGYQTHQGVNDSIPLAVAANLTSSLGLIRVDQLVLTVYAPGKAFGNMKRRVHGDFRHNGVDYKLWVTDPGYERHYLAMADGDYPLGRCFLTVSLGEPFNDATYKLIAAIIPDA